MTAFWMTYKLDKWPIDLLREVVSRYEDNGYADEAWRIAAWKQAKVGDTAFIFKQGSEPRGIIGVGTITGAPELVASESPDPDRPRYFAPIRWSRIVDPTKSVLLPYEEISEFVPSSLINSQASGIRIPLNVADIIRKMLSMHGEKFVVDPEDFFNPTDIEDARNKIMTEIHRRQGQGAFRASVLEAYEGRCAITGCRIQEVLEAAHIYPYRGAETNTVVNGLLLRTDLHTLFDLGLIAVDSTNFTLLLSRKLSASAYKKLAGLKLRLPKNTSMRPSIKALDLHREQSKVCICG